MGVLEKLAADIEEILRLLKQGAPPKQTPLWIAQTDEDGRDSPLGRRNHCKIVRERIAEGKDDAMKVGKRHLLTPEALQEELARRSSAPLRRTSPPADGGDVYARAMSARVRKTGNTR